MKQFNLSLAALIACLVTGCTSVRTQTAKVQYKPQNRGSLSSVKAKSVMIQVNDQRPVEEQNCVTRFRASSIDPTFVFVTKEPVPEILRNALKQELEVNGHRVVSEAIAKPDASITIGLKRFFATLSGPNKVAEVNAEVLVARPDNRPPAGPFAISGNFKKTHVGIMRPDPSVELSAALTDFVHSLTLDPRFLEALQ